MEKFPSQQAALRTALTQVLGYTPKKGELVISDDQRQQVGKLMMEWLNQGLWSIRPGTRAAKDPLNYIVGKQPTCLIEAWTRPRQQSQRGAESSDSKLDLLKKAVEAGLLSKEQAAEQLMKLLSEK